MVCATDFQFSSSQQMEYKKKGYENRPKRCPKCRGQVCNLFSTPEGCPYGDNCKFLHQAAAPDSGNDTTAGSPLKAAQPAPRRKYPCHFFEAGRCDKGDSCPFSHDKAPDKPWFVSVRFSSFQLFTWSFDVKIMFTMISTIDDFSSSSCGGVNSSDSQLITFRYLLVLVCLMTSWSTDSMPRRFGIRVYTILQSVREHLCQSAHASTALIKRNNLWVALLSHTGFHDY